MPRTKTFKTVEQLIYHYIDLYYKLIERNPLLRQNPEKHFIQINHINSDYLKALKKREEQFDCEANKEGFMTRIEVLTQVQKKIREKEIKNAAILALKQAK